MSETSEEFKQAAKGMARHWLRSFSELTIVMGVGLIPMFLLAAEIDGDEWSKASGTAMIAGVFAFFLAAYRMWRSGS